MKCPFCEDPKKNNTNFDNVDEHLIIVRKGKHVHVHGPFENEYVMREMLKSLIAEMEKNGMPFMPSTEHRIGD